MKKTFSLLMILILCGCSSLDSGTKTAVSEKPKTSVVILDTGLSDKIKVDKIILDRTPNGLLVVQSIIRSLTISEPVQIQVQTLFKNKYDQVLYSQPGSEVAWFPLVLDAKQTFYHNQQALTSEAVAATVRIRYLHR